MAFESIYWEQQAFSELLLYVVGKKYIWNICTIYLKLTFATDSIEEGCFTAKALCISAVVVTYAAVQAVMLASTPTLSDFLWIQETHLHYLSRCILRTMCVFHISITSEFCHRIVEVVYSKCCICPTSIICIFPTTTILSTVGWELFCFCYADIHNNVQVHK